MCKCQHSINQPKSKVEDLAKGVEFPEIEDRNVGDRLEPQANEAVFMGNFDLQDFCPKHCF